MKQLLESNRKLALFNDYVIDMTNYRFEHPGGKAMIDQCVGKDIGKFIYGAYSIEDCVNPHTHSFVAHKIITRLVCAKLTTEVKDEELSFNESINEVEILSSNKLKQTEKIKIIAKVENVFELQPGVYRVRLGDSFTKFHIFSQGLELACKCYLLTSVKNQVSRYYTI